MPVELVVVPKPVLDEPLHWALPGIHTVLADSQIALLGHADLVKTAAELRVDWALDFSHEQLWAVAAEGETVRGYAMVALPLRANPAHAWFEIAVHPEFRGCGIGTRLAEWAEAYAAGRGRTVWAAEVPCAPAVPGEPVLTADGGPRRGTPRPPPRPRIRRPANWWPSPT